VRTPVPTVPRRLPTVNVSLTSKPATCLVGTAVGIYLDWIPYLARPISFMFMLAFCIERRESVCTMYEEHKVDIIDILVF